MSKMAAIQAAVVHQLAADGKEGDLRRELRTCYGDKFEAERFLLAVSRRLRLDTPAIDFRWTAVEPEKMLDKRMHVVVDWIESNIKGGGE
jgi:hypothetical protein